MDLLPEEPEVRGCRVEPLKGFVRGLLAAVAPGEHRPALVGVDGRSSSGKTSLAGRIAAAMPNTALVHTDDIAWAHSRFGWADLIVAGVLDPLWHGRGVSYRPPAWERDRRTGRIEVEAGRRLVVIEGVGVGRRDLGSWLDALVWVQSDQDVMERRSLARVGAPGGPPNVQALREWMAEEVPFLAEERPWERATYIVVGSSTVEHDVECEVVVAPGPLLA